VRISYYVLSFQVLFFYIFGDYALSITAVVQLGILNVVLHIINIIYIFLGLLDQYILAIVIQQALLTNGPQIIHVFKHQRNKYETGFYLMNLLLTVVEFGSAFSRRGFVDRNKGLCANLSDAIQATQKSRAVPIGIFLAICIALVGFDCTVVVVDRYRARQYRANRNKGTIDQRKPQFFRPDWLTWKVTHVWTATRRVYCFFGLVIWIMSVFTGEFFVIHKFHDYVQQGQANIFTYENEWSYGQLIPLGTAFVGVLYTFRQWMIQPPKRSGKITYGEGPLHNAARRWEEAKEQSLSRTI
jgi:hypothetical protein